jgi:hypothetical protein
MKFKKYVELNESKSENIAPDSLKVHIIDRFNKDTHVTLEELQELANRYSVDYDKIVETICDLMQGMLYRRKGIRKAKIDPKELAMGTKHEMEHTDNPHISEIIARDHLATVPNYYTLLKEIDDD